MSATATGVYCSFCSSINVIGAQRCAECGHKPGIPKKDCRCSKCQRLVAYDPMEAEHRRHAEYVKELARRQRLAMKSDPLAGLFNGGDE